jgi:hypothetical protein
MKIIFEVKEIMMNFFEKKWEKFWFSRNNRYNPCTVLPPKLKFLWKIPATTGIFLCHVKHAIGVSWHAFCRGKIPKWQSDASNTEVLPSFSSWKKSKKVKFLAPFGSKEQFLIIVSDIKFFLIFQAKYFHSTFLIFPYNTNLIKN